MCYPRLKGMLSCSLAIGWLEAIKAKLVSPKLIQDAIEKVKLIQGH
jgi:hypothetical protein